MANSDRRASPVPSNLPPIPSSPTYSYASTTLPLPSTYNLPPPPPPPIHLHPVLNKNDLETSQNAYHTLLQSAKEYRLSLTSLSVSASTFGGALEACARLKEARSETLENSQPGSVGNSWHSGAVGRGGGGTCTADSLLAASGVHQLIANHQQILSETVYRDFEVPLLHEFDQWQRRMEEEELSYQREAMAMSKEIKRMEKEGLKLQKSRKRDVSRFREHLVELTRKLDGLTGLSSGHGRAMVKDCQDMSRAIVDCSAGLVRAEVDIFEALARKGWNGGGLDDLLEKGRDLFANEDRSERNERGDKIFSILPQNRSILAQGEGMSTKSDFRHARNDSFLADGLSYHSFAGAVRDADANSIFSDRDNTVGILNRPRPVRPFSPTLGERVRGPLENWAQDEPDDLKHGSEDGEDSEGGAVASTETVVPQMGGAPDAAVPGGDEAATPH